MTTAKLWRSTVAVALSLVQLLAQPGALVKRDVDALPIGGRLTVTLLDGREYYGHLRSIEPDSFSIREVDLRRVVTLRYDEVKRVRKDFGRPGFGGRRVHPRRALIVSLAVIGGLLALVFIVVASDKS